MCIQYPSSSCLLVGHRIPPHSCVLSPSFAVPSLRLATPTLAGPAGEPLDHHHQQQQQGLSNPSGASPRAALRRKMRIRIPLRSSSCARRGLSWTRTRLQALTCPSRLRDSPRVPSQMSVTRSWVVGPIDSQRVPATICRVSVAYNLEHCNCAPSSFRQERLVEQPMVEMGSQPLHPNACFS